MKSHQILFKIECAVGDNRIVVYAIIDRKNKSIHLHFHGDMFSNKRKPILQMKNSGIALKEGKETELITSILTDYFSDQRIEIKNIEKLNDQEDLSTQGHPLRIIIRLAR